MCVGNDDDGCGDDNGGDCCVVAMIIAIIHLYSDSGGDSSGNGDHSAQYLFRTFCIPDSATKP